MTSGLNISAAQVKDHRYSGPVRHQRAVAKLPGAPAPSIGRRAMKHGLAMKTNGGDVGKGDAVIGCEPGKRVGLRHRQLTFRGGEDGGLGPLEIPALRRIDGLRKQRPHLWRIGPCPMGSKPVDGLAIGAQKCDINLAVQNRARHQAGEPFVSHVGRGHAAGLLILVRVRQVSTFASKDASV